MRPRRRSSQLRIQPPMNDRTIRVLLVDDNADMTAVYSRLIDAEPDMRAVWTLGAADELFMEARRLRPDVVVLDLTMPGRQPIDALKELSAEAPDVRTIVFSGYDDAHTIDEVTAAGAWGL